MLSCHDLIHRHAQGPHVGFGPVPLQVENLRSPVGQRVRHGLCYQHLAKELMSVPGCIQLNFTKLAKQGRVVVLDED